MAKERARRRAEREAAALEQREQRATQRRRADRAQRWRQRLRAMLPDKPHTTPGLLARRRRRRLAALAGIIVVICAITWPLLPDWGGRIVVLVGLLMAAPVAWVMSFGRV